MARVIFCPAPPVRWSSEWTAKQVLALSKLGYQVADKGVASVLVELHNRRIFEAGLVVAGTLAYMSWLNEYETA
jgi:hypothetical protein